MSKPEIFIENWGTVRDDSKPYKAPEIRGRMLTGHIHDHPRIGENKQARTSQIVKYDLLNPAGPSIETVSSIYLLGFPADNFISSILTLYDGDVEDNEFVDELKMVGMWPDGNGWYSCKPPQSPDYTFIGYGRVAGEVNKPDEDRCMTFVTRSKNGDYESQGYHYRVDVTDGYAAWMKVEYWRHGLQLPSAVLNEKLAHLMPKFYGG